MSELLQFLIAGITVGAIYSVVALGFTMIYNVSGVVNFAQGEFVMLGAMLSVAGITIGIPFPIAAMIAIGFTALISVTLYDLAIRPARGAPMFALVIITIGASILIRGISKIFLVHLLNRCQRCWVTLLSTLLVQYSSLKAWW